MNELFSASIILFRFVNFGILIGIFWYLFNKHARASLLAQIQAKETEFNALATKSTALALQEKTMHEAMHSDRQECERLKEKVVWWRQAVTQEKESQYRIMQQRAEYLKLVTAQQAAGIAKQQALQEAAPVIIAQVKKELETSFGCEEKAKNYQDRALKYLENA